MSLGFMASSSSVTPVKNSSLAIMITGAANDKRANDAPPPGIIDVKILKKPGVIIKRPPLHMSHFPASGDGIRWCRLNCLIRIKAMRNDSPN